MREINLIVVHCSATPPSADVGEDEIREWHLKRGWSDIGYHAVIRRNGIIQDARRVERPGAHVRGHNANSLAVCLVGGVDEAGEPENNFTADQFIALDDLLHAWCEQFPAIVRIVGHRDLSPDADGDGVLETEEWLKDCPSFDVRAWLRGVAPDLADQTGFRA